MNPPAPNAPVSLSSALLRWTPWALAGAALLAAALLALRTLSLREEAETLRTRQALAETSAQHAQLQLEEHTLLANRALADLGARRSQAGDLAHLKIIQLSSPLANLPRARGTALWDPARHRGLLVTSELPVVAESLDYQLWLATAPGAAPVSAGVFKTDSHGGARLAFASDGAVAEPVSYSLTIEPRGGSAQPAGPLVLSGK